MIQSMMRGAWKQALDAFYTLHSPIAVGKFSDVIAVKGQGTYVWTADGRKLLDMCTGIGVTSTGHCHPRVVKAVQEQAATIVHAQQNVFGAHPKSIELSDRLSKIMPPHLTRYFLCNSGAEAIDNALKIARAVTGRPNVIVFNGGYHGRTIGSMSLTTSKTVYRAGFAPLMPGVLVAPYPSCLHCPVQEERNWAGYPVSDSQACSDPVPATNFSGASGVIESGRNCCGSPIKDIEMMLLMQSAPSETAAIFLEPILGEGGFYTPPPGFLRALREICDKHKILLVADEVQSGVGRTGKWWGYQCFDDGAMQPDLLVFAKGIASGYPIAGVASRHDAYANLVPGSMGGTYGGNAVACAAAVATVDVIIEEGVLENVKARGSQLMKGLLAIQREVKPGLIIDVRGEGLMLAVEFGQQANGGAGKRINGPPSKGFASSVTQACGRRDMLLLSAGARETIRFLPPLTVNEEEIDAALAIFKEAVIEAASKI